MSKANLKYYCSNVTVYLHIILIQFKLERNNAIAVIPEY